MPPIRQVGISPSELDQLVAGERWRRWSTLEPDLTAVGSLEEFRSLRGEAEDRIIGALLRLAAKDYGDDELAAVALVHQFGGAVRILSRRLRNLAHDDIEGVVVGAMWEQIRTFPCERRKRHFAASVIHGTRRAVLKTLAPGRDWKGVDRVVLLNPQSWAFEVLVEEDELAESRQRPSDSEEELSHFLSWAVESGFVGSADANLLVDLMASDRSNAAIPKWLRGVCSVAAVEQVAVDRGISAKTVFRTRDRVIAKLRVAVPAYVDEVA